MSIISQHSWKDKIKIKRFVHPEKETILKTFTLATSDRETKLILIDY